MGRQQSPAGCVCFSLRRATRHLTQYYDAAIQPAGLRVTQFSLLGAIASHEGTGISHLAEVMGMDRTTLTRNLKALERAGYVTVSPGPDRRVRTVSLTDEGRRKLAQALPLWRKAQESVVAELGPERVARLMRLFRAIEAIGD